MTLKKQQEGGNLILSVGGRLDTATAPQLEEALQTSLDGVTHLTLDLEKLAYVSSAGLRVILTAQKQMTKRGGVLSVRNVSVAVLEVFVLTGFTDILTLE